MLVFINDNLLFYCYVDMSPVSAGNIQIDVQEELYTLLLALLIRDLKAFHS